MTGTDVSAPSEPPAGTSPDGGGSPSGEAFPDGGGSAFAAQLGALRADGERAGRYRVDVDARWICPTVPHGGLMAALAARAMATELAVPDQRLRSLTAVFAAPVPAGPVTVDVEVLRRGRSMSQAKATVHGEGATSGHTTLAVFGGPRAGFAFTDPTMPAVPPPSDCPSFRDEPPDGEGPVTVPFWDQVEGRPAMGHAPWDDYVPDRSDCATWYRFDQPPRGADGALDPLALVTLCDTMPASVEERMGPGQPDWWGPSTDLTVHLLGESRAEWVLAAMRAHRAGDGYASVEVMLWDPDVGLVAYGTQVMFFTFPGGPPPPEQRVPTDQRG